MKYKILFCDVDGTLLTSQRVLTPENINAVKLAIENGIIFVIATGRPYMGILELVKALNIADSPSILFNGAEIKIGEKTLYSLTLPKDVAYSIIEEGHKRNSTMVVWSDGMLYTEKLCGKISNYKALSGVEPIIVDDLSSFSDKNIQKILWYDDPVSTAKYFAEMKQMFDKKASVFPSRADFLEFVNIGCSKRTALEKIAAYYGVPISQTVAVGDSYNDIPMLEAAGLSVAMGNADAAVKQACKTETLSCDQSGVAHLIYRIIEANKQN